MGSRSEDIKKKNERIGELEAEIKILKAQIKTLESRYKFIYVDSETEMLSSGPELRLHSLGAKVRAERHRTSAACKLNMNVVLKVVNRRRFLYETFCSS